MPRRRPVIRPTASSASSSTVLNGPQGATGWSPIFAVVSDGSRRVLQVTDWTGGGGSKPSTGDYLGASGLTSQLANAVDIRGGAGATGATGSAGTNGTNGTNGYAPRLVVENDNDRRVLKILDWDGGTGTKPAAPKYLGSSGLVDAIGQGVDIRGSSGAGAIAAFYNSNFNALDTVNVPDANLTIGGAWIDLLGSSITWTPGAENRTHVYRSTFSLAPLATGSTSTSRSVYVAARLLLGPTNPNNGPVSVVANAGMFYGPSATGASLLCNFERRFTTNSIVERVVKLQLRTYVGTAYSQCRAHHVRNLWTGAANETAPVSLLRTNPVTILIEHQ